MDVPLGNVAAAGAGLVALVWCFAGIAFLIGAATGRRGNVVAVSGVLAVATYLARAISGIVPGLDWLKWASPFHYFIGSDPLHTGWHPGYLAVLAVAALVTAAAGVLLFDRRDIGV
jgi:ABC-2 type transport system permease protein